MNDSSPTSCPEPTLFPLAAKGCLEEAVSVEIFAHADSCERCRDRLRQYEAAIFDDTVGEIGTISSDETELGGLLASIARLPLKQDFSVDVKNGGPADTNPNLVDQRIFREEVRSFRSDRYRLLQLLGRGAMGSVYLAEDKSLHRRVALKLPTRRMGDNAKWNARFRREARAAAKLRHPNICPVFDFGKAGDREFIAMAYIDGVSIVSA